MPKKLVLLDKIAEDFRHLVEAEPNHALYSALSGGVDIAGDVRELILPPGYRLVRIDGRLDIDKEHFELAVINDVVNEVVYYNRVITQNDVELNCRPVSQVLVWRTHKPQHKLALRDLPARLFFNYLIEQYNVIVSDVNQTSEGMSFWQARMYEALTYGFKVYGYDVLTCELIKIISEDDVGNNQSWLWGCAENYMNRLAIISTTALPMPAN